MKLVKLFALFIIILGLLNGCGDTTIAAQKGPPRTTPPIDQPPDGQTSDGDLSLNEDPDFCAMKSSGGDYVGDVIRFRDCKGLSDAWSTWMIENQNTLQFAYNNGRGDRSVRVKVEYDQVIDYDPPWQDEDEHMVALKQLAELAFPGWDFTFSIDEPSPDVTAVLGYTGIASRAVSIPTPTVFLIYETVFNHEFAHLLGVRHHYCGDDFQNTAICELAPPDEGPCIMSRDSNTWGPTEQFLLYLTGERSDDEIREVASDILNRYP